MKEELEIAKHKTVATLWEVQEGTDVWMIFPDLHKTKPLLVTRGKIADSNGTYLMQQIEIDIHDREGMETFGMNGKGIFLKKLMHNPAFASEKCYLTEDAAQKALDERNAKELERTNKLRQMYEKVAKVYMFEHEISLSEDDLNNYIKGFIDCAMYFRDYKSLLDIQPNVPGIEKMKDFTDKKFGFE